MPWFHYGDSPQSHLLCRFFFHICPCWRSFAVDCAVTLLLLKRAHDYLKLPSWYNLWIIWASTQHGDMIFYQQGHQIWICSDHSHPTWPSSKWGQLFIMFIVRDPLQLRDWFCSYTICFWKGHMTIRNFRCDITCELFERWLSTVTWYLTNKGIRYEYVRTRAALLGLVSSKWGRFVMFMCHGCVFAFFGVKFI